MRKVISGFLILLMCGLSEVSFANASTNNNLNTEQSAFFGKRKKNRSGKKKKNGRYKKRRGLFGKKNGCGCPKH